MGYVSSYDPINWQNSPSVATPINATNLNKMDSAIDALDEAMGQISASSRVFAMNVERVASDRITAYIGDDSIGSVKDLIILNTLNKSGTTSSSWSLYLASPVPSGTTKTLALKNADGSAVYDDAVDANAIMFILVTSSSTANVVGVVNSSNIDFPLSIDKGGTGNTAGYIRTGQRENTTIGTGATAEGTDNTASGNYSHAEGKSNISSSFYTHAEGQSTIASGQQSHAEGFGTRARNNSAHAEGVNTEANGEYSHAGGLYTVAAYNAQTAIGKFNDNKSDTLLEVGNGTYTNARSNALEVKGNGDVIAGNDVINADGYSLRAAENAISNPKTVTGNPVIIEDALECNADGLTTKIVPIQDLHGQANPYPAGGGKNKLPMTVAEIKALNTGSTWDGNKYTVSRTTFELHSYDGVYVDYIKVSTDSSGASYNANLNLGTFVGENGTNYIINGCPSGGSGSSYNLSLGSYGSDTGSGKTFTYTTSQRAQIWVVQGTIISNKMFYPMIRLASVTDPTYAPYANICPISGRTAVNIKDEGRNLFNKNDLESGAIDPATGENVSHDTTMRTAGYISVQPNTTYTFSAATLGAFRLFEYTDDAYVGSTVGAATMTTGSTTTRVRLHAPTFATMANTFMMEVGNVATPYEPYITPVTILIQLGTTVYGGSLDVKTGVLTITHKYVKLTAKTQLTDFALSENYGASAKITSTTDVATDGSRVLAICSMCKGVKADDRLAPSADINRVFANGVVYIRAANTATVEDVDDLFAIFEDADICYKLATPTTVQLTGAELEMLKGYNRVTSDSGELTLTYKANAVQAKADEIQITTNVEMGTKASKAYTVNQFMLRSDGLYKVTANIASGATLTSSNTTKVTICEVLTALLNG